YLFCLLLVSLPFALSARAMSTSGSVDGIDCITSYDPPSVAAATYSESFREQAVVAGAGEEPLRVVADKSAGWPNDSDNGPSVSVDRATLPTRTNKKPIHFSGTRFEVVTVHELATDPILLFPIHCFYSVHEHIRERAPPGLA